MPSGIASQYTINLLIEEAIWFYQRYKDQKIICTRLPSTKNGRKLFPNNYHLQVSLPSRFSFRITYDEGGCCSMGEFRKLSDREKRDCIEVFCASKTENGLDKMILKRFVIMAVAKYTKCRALMLAKYFLKPQDEISPQRPPSYAEAIRSRFNQNAIPLIPSYEDRPPALPSYEDAMKDTPRKASCLVVILV